MRMQNSILFCHSNNQATSVLEAPIKQILDNLTENMSENNYLAISRALRTIEFLIFTPLFNEAKTLNYIRNNKDGIDPTILGICNYLDDKFGYSK